MTVSSLALRVLPRPTLSGRAREAVLLAASVAADTVAAAILLIGAPIPAPIGIVAAAASHGLSALLLAGLTRSRPSRLWLGVSAVLAVPLAGAAVAAVTLTTKGRGSAAVERRGKVLRRPALRTAEIHRLGEALSSWDALTCGDQDERRAALARLSRRDDPEAIALLRRAAADRDPDLSLSAALVLDEIGERAERDLDRRERTEVRHGTA